MATNTSRGARVPMLAVYSIDQETGDVLVGLTPETMPRFIVMLSQYGVVRLPRRWNTGSNTEQGTAIFDAQSREHKFENASLAETVDEDLPQTRRWQRWLKKLGW